MSVLALHGVSKSFGGIHAVDGLSLAIQPGMITGLIGPNGAGKTTVVNLLTGMLRPTSGRITLGEQDITTLAPEGIARLGVSRTFQNIRLLTHATVLENVVIGYHRQEVTSLLANLLGLPGAVRERNLLRNKAAALLKTLNIEHLADRPAGELAYGHQRRVEIARALALSPLVLLLDEPVAGMNDVEATELGELFESLAASGLAILLIEHNVRFVMRICKEIYAVDQGRLICSGTPERVRNDPRVVSAYLG